MSLMFSFKIWTCLKRTFGTELCPKRAMNSNSPQRQKNIVVLLWLTTSHCQHCFLAALTPSSSLFHLSLSCLCVCLSCLSFHLSLNLSLYSYFSFFLFVYVFVFPGCAAFLSKSLSLLLSVCSSHHNAHLPFQPLTCLDLASPGCAAPPSHGTAHAGGRLWNISALLWIRRCLDAWSFPHRQDCQQVDCGSPAPPGNGR